MFISIFYTPPVVAVITPVSDGQNWSMVINTPTKRHKRKTTSVEKSYRNELREQNVAYVFGKIRCT
jgi:hypothetical protein